MAVATAPLMEANDAEADHAADLGRGNDQLRHVIRPVVAFLANATVLTALLVYFGWRRSETHAAYLGIDESILGMSTRDYALRSVGPVLTILVAISVFGLVGSALDRRMSPAVQAAMLDGRDGTARTALRALASAWLVLPALVWIAGTVWPDTAYVLFPASIGAGVVLWLYGGYLRQLHRPPTAEERRRCLVTNALGALLVAVCLFWTASNYAEVLGGELARDFIDGVGSLPRVAATSEHPLRLEGPGITEAELPGAEGDMRYRTTGLRFLEHTGGRYFLVSDGWSPTYGVVFVIPDDDRSVRLDFVHDHRVVTP